MRCCLYTSFVEKNGFVVHDAARAAAFKRDVPQMVSDIVTTIIGEDIKARVVCGAVHENGMGPAHTDKFFQPFLKAFPVDELFRAAACGADADDAVLRDPVPTVTPGFTGTPTDIIEDRDSVSSCESCRPQGFHGP